MIEEEELVCDGCGEAMLAATAVLVGEEPPSYGMNDPYPGYAGDLVCEVCAASHGIAP